MATLGVSRSLRPPSLEPVIVGAGGREKEQAELAYLDFVAVGQNCRLPWLTVDIGAVEAADVNDLELVVLASELGVPAADGDVIAEDVAVGVSAGGGDRLIKREPRSRVRAPFAHQQCVTVRQLVDPGDGVVYARRGRCVRFREVSPEGRGDVGGGFLRRVAAVLVG